jgi:Na+-translocating ferredoxin:NAD+ oxidoreductase RnfG subunit
MNSRSTLKVIVWLHCVLGSLAVADGGGGAVPAFVKDGLGPEAVQRTLELDEETRTETLRIMGGRYPETTVAYWQSGTRTGWILQGRGRSGEFTAGFVVSAGRIVDCRVLEYRESHGKAIKSERFLRQFRDAALRDDRQLDRRIDGLTGATISVKSITNLARLALYFDQKIPPPAATE